MRLERVYYLTDNVLQSDWAISIPDEDVPQNPDAYLVLRPGLPALFLRGGVWPEEEEDNARRAVVVHLWERVAEALGQITAAIGPTATVAALIDLPNHYPGVGPLPFPVAEAGPEDD